MLLSLDCECLRVYVIFSFFSKGSLLCLKSNLLTHCLFLLSISHCLSQQHLSLPLSQQHLSLPLSRQHLSLSLSAASLIVSQQHLSLSLSQQHLSLSLSQQHLSLSLSQQHLSLPLSAASLIVSLSAASLIASQQHLSLSLSQQHLSLSLSSISHCLSLSSISHCLSQQHLALSLSQQHLSLPLSSISHCFSLSSISHCLSLSQQHLSLSLSAASHCDTYTHTISGPTGRPRNVNRSSVIHCPLPPPLSLQHCLLHGADERHAALLRRSDHAGVQRRRAVPVSLRASDGDRVPLRPRCGRGAAGVPPARGRPHVQLHLAHALRLSSAAGRMSAHRREDQPTVRHLQVRAPIGRLPPHSAMHRYHYNTVLKPNQRARSYWSASSAQCDAPLSL